MSGASAAARSAEPAFAWRTVSVAALGALPFALLCTLLLALAPPGNAQLQAADPLIHLLPALARPFTLLGATAAVAALWYRGATPTRDDLRTGLRQAAIATALIAIGLPILRLVVGPELPSFVPSEESARPGMPLGLAAGLSEELVFRLALLPALMALLGATLPARLAAAFLVGLAFAASHEIGPGAVAFSATHFATRLAIPGTLMSLLFIFVGPPFLVTAHCAAHLVLPLLFR